MDLISRINQSFLQSEDRRLLMREYDTFQADFKLFEIVNDELRKQTAALREHEAAMRQ